MISPKNDYGPLFSKNWYQKCRTTGIENLVSVTHHIEISISKISHFQATPDLRVSNSISNQHYLIFSDTKIMINGMGRSELLGKHISGINTKRTGLFSVTCPKLNVLLTTTLMNYQGCHIQCYHSFSFQLLNQQCQCAEGMQIIVLDLCIVTVIWKILEILAPLFLLFIANHKGIIDT